MDPDEQQLYDCDEANVSYTNNHSRT
ncbi:unnamed protein product, partial [Rotaria magnacalcarata]